MIREKGLATSGQSHSRGMTMIKLMLCGVLLLLVSFFSIRYSISTAFFFSLGSAYALTLLYLLFKFCLFEHRAMPGGRGSFKALRSTLLVALISAFLLEMLTLWGAPVSTPLVIADWSVKRVLVYFMLALSVEVYVLFLREDRVCAFSCESLSCFSREYWKEKLFLNSILATFFITLLCIVFYLLLSVLAAFIGGEEVGRLTFFLLCSASGMLIIACMFKGIVRKPEIVFLILCLFSGSILVFCLPPVTAISWDDEIHYDRALGLSYLGHAEISEADRLLVHKPWAAVDLDFNLVRSAVDDVAAAEPDTNDAAGYSEVFGFATPVRGVSLADVSAVGYFPSAIALWLARLFHAPILFSVVLGRFGNLISYALAIATAIRIVPARKGVMIAIGLLPTSVFLASSFSYDPVVISFLLLAVALIMRELRTPEARLTKLGLLKICGALFVGLAPKAIYFPLIGLLLLMPRDKFHSDKSYKKYVCTVIAFGVLMIASFALPMLFSATAQAGDARGGTDVSAIGQIAFILSHPIEYVQILCQFMLSYLSPVSSDMYTFSYAYMGFLPSLLPWVSSFGFILLSLTVALDIQQDSFSQPRWTRIWVAFLFVMSVALVCTSLYVSYTPVGLSTINGVQLRYLTPLLFTASLCAPSLGSMRDAQGNECVAIGCSVSKASILLPSVSMSLLLSICSWCFALCW